MPGSASGHAGLLLAAMYVLSVVGFPLVSTVPVLLGLDSQAATVPYRAAMAGLSFAILYGWWLQRTRVLFTLPVVLALSLWVLLMGRLLLDTVIEPLPGEIGMPLSQFLLLSLGACFLPSLAFLQAPSVMTSDLARRMIEMLGAVALLLLLYLGLQGVFAGGVLRRLSTPVLNPISVGHLAVSVLIVAMCGLAGAGLSARVLRWLLMAVSMVVIVASASRGPILATLLVVLVFAFGRKRPGRYGPLRVAGYVVLITGLVVGVMLAVDWLEQNDYVRLAERLSDTMADASAQERLAMATGAWRQFLDKPVLGSYALELRSYTYPHNVLLESLMATGIVGFALLLGSMGPATLAALRIIRAESPYMWIALIYLQYVVHCMVSGSLYLEASFWSFAFGSLAVAQAIPRAGNARRQ